MTSTPLKLAAFTLLALSATVTVSQAQHFSAGERDFQANSQANYVSGGVGIGRTAFPISGAIPAGEPYDPYRLPYTYDWPYGYGYTAR